MSGYPDFSRMSMLEAALRYARMGWPVFPLAPRGKLPLIPKDQGGNGCEDATLNERIITEWWTREPKANIGLAALHRWFVLDKDPKDGGDESLEYLINQRGPLPETIVQITGTGGEHYLFAVPPDFRVRNSQGNNGGLIKGIDIRGYHGYIVGAPSIHPDTGIAYQWYGEDPLETRTVAEAPAWLLDWLRKHAARLDGKPEVSASPSSGVRFAKGSRHPTLLRFAGSLRRKNLPAELIYQMLCVMNRDCCEPPYPEQHLRKIADWVGNRPADARHDLFKTAPQDPDKPLAPVQGDEDDKLAIAAADVEAAVQDAIARNDLRGAIALASEIAKLRPSQAAVQVSILKQHFGADAAWPKDYAAIVRAETRLQGKDSKPPSPPPPETPEGAGEPPGGGVDLRFYPLTDAGNGERIKALCGEDIRFCWEMKEWLVWDGKRWAVDHMHLVRQKARLTARTLYKQALGNGVLEKHARSFESWKDTSAALNWASTDPELAISASELDQHAYLLNCPNGVLDLKSERLLPHNREFLITKLCPVPFDRKAQCPLFLSFIEWAMGSKTDNPDAELDPHVVRLVGFLQRALGLSLTSDTTERAVFVFYGSTGGNGKTTLLTLFRDLLGNDYSGQISIETIMAAKQVDATMRADLADLRGVRFAVTSEIEKEHKLNSRFIKYITAGLSFIKSCRKYENPIEFPATHHLFMDCNHRPRITDGDDDPIWGRMKLIPFEVSKPKEQRDLTLPAKLRTELPGILAWAVRGCASWVREGLGGPPEVEQAALAWREHDDPLRQFLEDCCERPDAVRIDGEAEEPYFVRVTELSEAYAWWCKKNNEKFPIGRENFNERLRSKGITENRGRRFDVNGAVDSRGTQQRTWEGVRLKADVSADLAGAALVSRPRSRQRSTVEEMTEG